MPIIMEMLKILTPVLVACATALGAIAVARVQQVQKYIKTNHGTSGLGNAIDRILDTVEELQAKQDELFIVVNAMKARGEAIEVRESSLEQRMAAIEKTRARLMEHVGLIPLPGEIPPVPKKKWRKR